MGLTHPRQLAEYPFDPLAPAVLTDPYPFYAWLRDHDPVHWGVSGDPGAAGCWYVTRYDHAVDLLKDGRFGRELGQPDTGDPTFPTDESIPYARTVAVRGPEQLYLARRA